MIHELTHVWQAEFTGPFYMSEAIHAQVLGVRVQLRLRRECDGGRRRSDRLRRHDGVRSTAVTRLGEGGQDELLAADGDFESFNREQQGQILMHYFVRKSCSAGRSPTGSRGRSMSSSSKRPECARRRPLPSSARPAISTRWNRCGGPYARRGIRRGGGRSTARRHPRRTKSPSSPATSTPCCSRTRAAARRGRWCRGRQSPPTIGRRVPVGLVPVAGGSVERFALAAATVHLRAIGEPAVSTSVALLAQRSPRYLDLAGRIRRLLDEQEYAADARCSGGPPTRSSVTTSSAD